MGPKRGLRRFRNAPFKACTSDATMDNLQPIGQVTDSEQRNVHDRNRGKTAAGHRAEGFDRNRAHVRVPEFPQSFLSGIPQGVGRHKTTIQRLRRAQTEECHIRDPQSITTQRSDSAVFPRSHEALLGHT